MPLRVSPKDLSVTTEASRREVKGPEFLLPFASAKPRWALTGGNKHPPLGDGYVEGVEITPNFSFAFCMEDICYPRNSLARG